MKRLTKKRKVSLVEPTALEKALAAAGEALAATGRAQSNRRNICPWSLGLPCIGTGSDCTIACQAIDAGNLTL